jgi:hypothetical protein
MSSLFDHRGEIYGLVDPLDDIHDARNGILLDIGFHHPLEAGNIALLKVCDLLSSLSIPCNSRIQ